MSPDDARHGTYAGHKQHKREDSEPCWDCSEAYRKWHRANSERRRRAAGQKARPRPNYGIDETEASIVAYCDYPGCGYRELFFKRDLALETLGKHLLNAHNDDRGRERLYKQRLRKQAKQPA